MLHRGDVTAANVLQSRWGLTNKIFHAVHLPGAPGGRFNRYIRD